MNDEFMLGHKLPFDRASADRSKNLAAMRSARI
jgi:hypothetical protein